MTPTPQPLDDDAADAGSAAAGDLHGRRGPRALHGRGPVALASPPPPPAPAPPPAPPAAVRSVVVVPRRPWGPTRVVTVVVAWVLVALACAGLVAYLLGPLVQNRQQRALLEGFRVALDEAAGESLFSDTEEPGPPELGAPVAILEIERLRLQQLVVEGAGPSQTQSGPGHVPGTGGLGQPGNAGVVGRRLAFGGPFRQLASMEPGDPIVVTTEQGQSLYEVRTVERSAAPEESFAPAEGDQLTLVTSADSLPWATDRGVVVTADLQGRPFVPTPQGSRSAVQDGRHGETAALGLLIVYGVLFAAVAAAATLLYRRWMSLSTYLLTTPALVALAVLAAESGTRLLPAWF